MTLPLPDMYKTGADIKKRLVRLEQPIAEAKSVENSAGASVTVAMQPDGKLKYSFSIPKGLKGDTGATGPAGPQGVPGKPGTTSWNDITEKPDFITKSTADITYLGIKGKAESAKIADSATKATQDAAGNVIASHYATKTEVSKKLDSSAAFTKATADTLYLGKTAKAESAKTADTATNATNATSANTAKSVAWANVSGRPDPITKTGDVGTITVMETISTATTVNDTSPRSMKLNSGGSLTVSNGSADKAWITVVALAGSGTINLGGSWSWSGSAPTLAKGLVTLAWYGSFGVATFTKYGS